MPQRLVVTGASGYLGARFVETDTEDARTQLMQRFVRKRGARVDPAQRRDGVGEEPRFEDVKSLGVALQARGGQPQIQVVERLSPADLDA